MKAKNKSKNKKSKKNEIDLDENLVTESSAGVIRITPLGAGQHVGRSCILVTMGKSNIMLDCGMHMGAKDEMLPDFNFILPNIKDNFKIISKNNQSKDDDSSELSGVSINKMIDLVIISHFHLDHVGALPYLTEKLGYSKKIIMSHPTLSIAPLLLKDFVKLNKSSTEKYFSESDIDKSMSRVTPIGLRESQIVCGGHLKVTALYAGHVLGAIMVFLEDLDTGKTLLYSGDFNWASDRHLSSASISGMNESRFFFGNGACPSLWRNMESFNVVDSLKLDVLITETTYASKTHESRGLREAQFLSLIHRCLKNGGRVLIPVFALGRVQELCILLESYFRRNNLKYPVFFSSPMINKANSIYRMYIDWMNENIKKSYYESNKTLFDFNFVKQFDKDRMINLTCPMVLFATPGMMHAGTSLEVFRKWSKDPKTLVLFVGYCVKGSCGERVLSAKRNNLKTAIFSDQSDSPQQQEEYFDFECQVEEVSFSAHADSKGIMELIRQTNPRHTVFVHGDKERMNSFKATLNSDMNLDSSDIIKKNNQEMNEKENQTAEDNNLEEIEKIEKDMEKKAKKEKKEKKKDKKKDKKKIKKEIEKDLNIPKVMQIHTPKDKETITLDVGYPNIEVNLSSDLITPNFYSENNFENNDEEFEKFKKLIRGVLVLKEGMEVPSILSPKQIEEEIGEPLQVLKYSSFVKIKFSSLDVVKKNLKKFASDGFKHKDIGANGLWFKFDGVSVIKLDNSQKSSNSSLNLNEDGDEEEEDLRFLIQWREENEKTGKKIISIFSKSNHI